MFRLFTAALVVTILAFSHLVDAKTDEFIQMKIFNHEFQVSDSQMHAMLKDANLTGHGYKVEIVTKEVQMADGAKENQEAHYYYKNVSCSKMQEVEEELRRLLPGAIKKEMGIKFKKEIKARNLTSMKTCKVGLEVHFKEAEGCYDNQKSVSKRREKRGCSLRSCFICINCEISNSGNNSGNNNGKNNGNSSSRRRSSRRRSSRRRSSRRRSSRRRSSRRRSSRRRSSRRRSSRRRSSRRRSWGR